MNKTEITPAVRLGLILMACLCQNLNLFAQCPVPPGEVLINEIGLYSSGGSATSGFVELVVGGYGSTSMVDVSGLILGNNNTFSSGRGASSGHLVLGECFSMVAPGTIILIYDGDYIPNFIDATKDGLPNDDGVYQLQVNSDCLEAATSCTGSLNSGYRCDLQPGNGSWELIAPSNQSGVIQVRRSGNELIHALSWFRASNVAERIYPDHNHNRRLKVYNGSIYDRSISLTGADPLNGTNYSINFNYTPGYSNSPTNSMSIDALKPLLCSGEEIILGCPESTECCFVWLPEEIVTPMALGQASVAPSETVVVRRYKLDNQGNILGVNAFPIRVRNPIEAEIQQQQLVGAPCIELAQFQLTASVTSQTGPHSFNWSNGQSSPTTIVNGGSSYSVTITGQDGCSVVKTHIPYGEEDMVARYDIRMSTRQLCEGRTTLLSVGRNFGNSNNRAVLFPDEVFSDEIGNQTRTYQWSNGSTAPTTRIIAPGVYKVTVSDYGGCTYYDEINVAAAPALSIIADQSILCENEPFTLTAAHTEGVESLTQYAWSNGSDTRQIVADKGGIYSVTVSERGGCTLEAQTEVTPGLQVTARAAAERLLLSGGVEIRTNVSLGVTPYFYQWSNGETTPSIVVSVPGTYKVTATDGTGCSATDEVTILAHQESLCADFSAAIVYSDPSCMTGGYPTLFAEISGDHKAASYQWSNGNQGAKINATQPNETYTVTVTSNDGCVFIASLKIPDVTRLPVGPLTNNPACDIVDKLTVLPLADEQLLLLVENLSESQLSAYLPSSSSRLDIRVSYADGWGAPITVDIPFARHGDVGNPDDWAGHLTGIEGGNEFTLTVVYTEGELCPTACTQSRTHTAPYSIDDEEVILEENPEITIEGYECGDEYQNTEDDTNRNPLLSLQEGELIYAHGFPIIVTSLLYTANSDGYYEGTGLVALPFNQRTLKVALDGIYINEQNIVYDGQIVGVSDQLNNYNFSLDTFMIGGPICQERQEPPETDDRESSPSSGYDEWGFNSLGINQITGQVWDEFGFDQNGNHVSTGSPYSPNGCTRELVNADGNYCEPERYIDSTAQRFIDSVGGEIPPRITNIVTQLIADTTLALHAQQAACNSLRGEMDYLVTQLALDSLYIYGDSSQFVNPGMSRNFTSIPQKFIPQGLERDSNVERLEEVHVELFYCDTRELMVREHLQLLLSASNSQLETIVFTELSYLDATTIASFTDSTVFNDWLTRVVELIIFKSERSGGVTSVGLLPKPIINSYASPIQQFKNLGTFAGESNGLAGCDSKKEMILYELNAQFRQGFTEIQGVHRAHYLDRLVRLREENDDPQLSNLLPLTVDKYLGGVKYSIILDDVGFSFDTGPTLNAYIVIEDPDSGQKLVFEAMRVAFGIGGAEEGSRLALASTVAIRLSNAAKLVLQPNATYVDWDCTGFTGMNIEGQVELCRDMITPLDEVTLEPLPEDENYKLNFAAYAFEWLDAVVTLNAGDFAVTGVEGIKWRLNNLVVDLSDKQTPDIVPCTGYSSRHYHDQHGVSPLWKGFYVEELQVSLPSDFSIGGDAVAIAARDVVIDDKGFSGSVFADNINILDIDDGSAGGWPFSIEKFHLSIIHNQLSGAGFGGDVILPLFPDDQLSYIATIESGNNFEFVVNGLPELDMSMLLAQAILDSNTTLSLGYGLDGFTAIANLHGRLNINVPGSEQVKVELPTLAFQGLQISNKAPQFQAGSWQVYGNQVGLDFGGFELNLDNIRPMHSLAENEFGLRFDIGLDLTKSLDIAAKGSFSIVGQQIEDDGRHRWNYKKLDLNGLQINTTIKKTVTINGDLKWFKQDSQYGSGFHGVVNAEFHKGPLNFTADVAAQFGRLQDVHYFFVDAMVGLGRGIPAGALNIDGFGGGLSYHMNSQLDPPSMNFTSGKSNHGGQTPIGQSFSGVSYAVDPTVGLGMQASVSLKAQSENIFNGWASLGLQFNAPSHGGGLHKFSIRGQGNFLQSPIDQMPVFVEELPVGDSPLDIGNKPDLPTPLTAWIDITYNHRDRVLDGKLETYLNVPPILYGAGVDGRLVQAQVHVGPNNWFINVGTPNNPAGTKMGVGSILNIESKSYFNVGTAIPSFPRLPKNVRSLTNSINLYEGLRKSGGGIMFGANLKANAGFDAYITSAQINAELGFDLMLRDYDNARCMDSSRPIGLDGWYASGQAWAYLHGRVKLFGVRIFEAGMATILQAQLPRPTFAKTSVTAYARLLFIRKKISFSVEIGDRCELLGPNGNSVEANKYILNINPSDNLRRVDIAVQPEIFFSYPIGEKVEYAGNNYELKIDEISITSSKKGYNWSFEEKQVSEGSAIRLIPNNLLPPNDSVILNVKIEVVKNGRHLTFEEKAISFTTGENYGKVPNSNIAYQYPISGMYNFYPDQTGEYKGFVQLIAGQPDIFTEHKDAVLSEQLQQPDLQFQSSVLYNESEHVSLQIDEFQIRHEDPRKESALRMNRVFLEGSDGSEKYLLFEYDALKRRIVFDLEPNDLIPEAVYRLTIGQYDGYKLVKTLVDPVTFRVSRYSTFEEKISDIASNSTYDQERITLNIEPDQYFDHVEIFGRAKHAPLVEMSVQGNTSYMNALDFILYDRLPFRLSEGVCGTIDIPSNSKFQHAGEAVGLLVQDISNLVVLDMDSLYTPLRNRQKLSYDVEYYAHQHHKTITQQILSCNGGYMADGSGSPTLYMNHQSIGELPDLPSGDYDVKLEYLVPGEVRPSYHKVTLRKN